MRCISAFKIIVVHTYLKKKEFKEFSKKVFKIDNYKILQNYFNSISVIQFFPLRDSWGQGILKTPSRKQHPNIYF